MVVNRSIEQGIVTLFVLAMQKGHTPVDSFTLSTVMGVSDSYLRKILQRLSRAGIVISVAGRQGGFVLARPLDQITTGEVFKVLGGEGVSFRGSKAAENAFGDIEGVSDAEREFVGSSDMTGEQGHGKAAPLVDSHHSRVLLLSAQEGGNRPHRDAAGAHEDQRVRFPEGARRQLREVSRRPEDLHCIFRREAVCDAPGCFHAPAAEGEEKRPLHGFASRNSVAKSGA